MHKEEMVIVFPFLLLQLCVPVSLHSLFQYECHFLIFREVFLFVCFFLCTWGKSVQIRGSLNWIFIFPCEDWSWPGKKKKSEKKENLLKLWYRKTSLILNCSGDQSSDILIFQVPLIMQGFFHTFFLLSDKLEALKLLWNK